MRSFRLPHHLGIGPEIDVALPISQLRHPPVPTIYPAAARSALAATRDAGRPDGDFALVGDAKRPFDDDQIAQVQLAAKLPGLLIQTLLVERDLKIAAFVAQVQESSASLCQRSGRFARRPSPRVRHRDPSPADRALSALPAGAGPERLAVWDRRPAREAAEACAAGRPDKGCFRLFPSSFARKSMDHSCLPRKLEPPRSIVAFCQRTDRRTISSFSAGAYFVFVSGLRRLEINMAETQPIDRKKMIELLNEDLSREYQAIIAYVNYSQVMKGPSTWTSPVSWRSTRARSWITH